MILIVIALFFLGCVAVAIAAMRLIPPITWQLGAVLSVAMVVYLLAIMPSGGPDNPLPWLMAFPFAVVAVAGALSELSLLTRMILAHTVKR